MKATIFRSPQILTSKMFQGFYFATHQHCDNSKVAPFSREVCEIILDRYPNIKTLNKLHSKIVVNEHLQIDPTLAIKLMRAYSACGETRVARFIFDSTFKKNVVFFNVMIRSYVNNNLYVEALSIYQVMTSCAFNPDHYTFPCVLKACSGLDNLRVGLQVHDAIVKVGLDSNLFIGNALVAMYGKCGCLREARKVLDQMPERDVVSWNSMVAGYAQSGQFHDALEICREMDSLKLNHDAGTMASLLPAVSSTSPENVQYIHKMFEKMARKSLVSWNVMIAIYVNNSMPNEAVNIFLQMEGCGMKPDAVTIASLLPACGDLSALFLGRRLHEYIEKGNLRPNLLLENALLDMYAKCGCLEEARDVFDKMKFRDVVSWTSMMSAYGISGQGYDAVALFAKMQESGLNPDSIAFVSVLFACSHAGLLDQGRHYFHVMTEQYRIVPRIEHFACMVDLLGRAGEVEEAYSFIQQMPMEPNERVWGALLSACRVHSKMDIGLLAADCLFQLAPKQSGYYVLLSNIYAKAGMWKDVGDVRYAMKKKGIKKVPGISNVELKGQVHTFLAGDQYHPQAKNIYEELDILVGKMKELGYIPQTESALHDVEVEDKECHLAIHSEKLAIVFAILNTKHVMEYAHVEITGEPPRCLSNDGDHSGNGQACGVTIILAFEVLGINGQLSASASIRPCSLRLWYNKFCRLVLRLLTNLLLVLERITYIEWEFSVAIPKDKNGGPLHQSQQQHHVFQIHLRTYVDSTIKWVRDRGLDHAVEREKNLLPVMNIKNFIKSEPSKSVPVSIITQKREVLRIPMRPVDLIRKYPSIFEEFFPGGISIQPHVRLTSEVLELDTEEQLTYQGETCRQQAADRLVKLLMLTRVHKIPLSIIDKLKWDLGLPKDYVQSIVPDFPDYFKVVGRQNFASASEGDMRALELVCWNNELATSVLEKMVAKGKPDTSPGTPITFPMKFSNGFVMDKKFKKWVDDWQKLPYISPYENASHLSPNSDESDKWTVAILHEFLHMLVTKKIEKENILCIGEYFGLRSRFKRALLHHPGIFYLSSKAGTYTVVLKEGYKRGSVIESSPLVNIRNKYLHLMNIVKEDGKTITEHSGTRQQKQEKKEGSDDGSEKKNEAELFDSSDDEDEDEDASSNPNIHANQKEDGRKRQVDFKENAARKRVRSSKRTNSTTERPYRDVKRERRSNMTKRYPVKTKV